MSVPTYHWPETVFAEIGVATFVLFAVACLWVTVTRAVRRRRVRAWLGVPTPRADRVRRWSARLRDAWRLGGMRAEDYERIAPRPHADLPPVYPDEDDDPPRPPDGPPCDECGEPIWRNIAHRIYPANHDRCRRAREDRDPARAPRRLTPAPPAA